MTQKEIESLFGQDFVNKVNRIRKLFHAQKTVIINEIQKRRPKSEASKK